MFDWNEEELTGIIWDESGEGDDHTVPYSDQKEKPPILFRDPTKKELNQGTANASHVEQKKSSIKSEYGVELDSNSKYDYGDPETGFVLHSWLDGPDPSSSNATKADENSMGTDASNNLTKKSRNDSVKEDETSQFDKDSEMFQNSQEDREQGDFVDYGWANIGSFDDLHRIFSNNDAIFGDMGDGCNDEQWSSSKDVTRSPLGPTPLPGDCSDLALGPLRTSSDRSEVKAQYMLDTDRPFIPGYEKLNKITSHDPENVQIGKKVQACDKQLDDGTTTATLDEFPDKSYRQRRLLKSQKLDKKSEVRQFHDLCVTRSSFGSPFQQVNNQYAPSVFRPFPSAVLTQQRQLQSLLSLPENHFSGPLVASALYGNVVNHHPATSVLAEFYPGDGDHELVSSCYEVLPGNANSLHKSLDSAVKPPAMTPKEKIEKLRRRQQMRAILAIKKQQQQFSNQVAVAEHSNIDGGNVVDDESVSILPSLDPNSPIENNDSNTTSMAYDNCSVEESVLYQLQDVIAKLELRLKLCIRDSLFRLAQSAMQRQYPTVTSSANTSTRDEVLGNEDSDSHERFTRMPDVVVETNTNPIDRTVAHLLFQRPLEFSGKPAELPELPGSKTAELFSESNQCKNSSGLDISENTSTMEL